MNLCGAKTALALIMLSKDHLPRKSADESLINLNIELQHHETMRLNSKGRLTEYWQEALSFFDCGEPSAAPSQNACQTLKSFGMRLQLAVGWREAYVVFGSGLMQSLR